MSIRLTEVNSVIYEIPKTGTTWIRVALKKLGIPFLIEDPILVVCDRHSPWWCYPNFPNDKRYCSVRHPIDWYESYWKFHQFVWGFGADRRSTRRKSTFHPGRWYQRQPLHLGEHIDYTFHQWIDRIISQHPGFYTRTIEAFMGPAGSPLMDGVLLQENLVDDFSLFLQEKGYGDRYNELREIPAANVSEPILFEWLPEQRERILYLEQDVIRRFYS